MLALADVVDMHGEIPLLMLAQSSIPMWVNEVSHHRHKMPSMGVAEEIQTLVMAQVRQEAEQRTLQQR
jgi:hypothetical protein